jgi:protein ImuB
MPAAKAQALVADLVIRDAAPLADAEALDRLARWLLRRYAPIVAADPPDGVVIVSTGADHLRGGEPAMLADIIKRLAVAGIAARAAIADSWGAAHGLARYAARPIRIAPSTSSALAIGSPCRSLRSGCQRMLSLACATWGSPACPIFSPSRERR